MLNPALALFVAEPTLAAAAAAELMLRLIWTGTSSCCYATC